MFIVIEMQYVNDKVSTIVNDYKDEAQANSKFHQIMSAAALSDVPVHSAVMLDETGMLVRQECYKHDAETEQ